jgi:hypothetical protein
MVRFMVYLFETGLCLSLLYAAYWLFLRKETYFNFNRIFLVGSIVLSLTVPLLHLNLMISAGGSLEDPAMGIIKFRSYYEELIGMMDADFGAEPSSRHRVEGNLGGGALNGDEGVLPSRAYTATGLPAGDRTEAGMEASSGSHRFSAARLILIIYIGGVMYFMIRFIYLLVRLYLLVFRNGVTRQEGFRMVEIQEDISPFSFFRFLFINQHKFNEFEMQNVLEHEKAHIRQKHSLDHLFAHGLAVFQWFNPFAWQIRNALKTTHEYIADHQVILRGFEIIDYQSLLLKQVIGYHSVEFVNNFNLKPIKKRIAMMTKTRSGIPARLKAMLVIPFAIFIFLLFADFTLKGPGNSIFNMNSFLRGPLAEKDLSGLWIKQTRDDFSNVIHFSSDLFSYMDGDLVTEYYWKMDQGELVLSHRKGSGGIRLKADVTGDELTLWWNDLKGTTYRKTGALNTMDHFLASQGMAIDLPYISQFRLMEKQSLYYRIALGYADDGSKVLTFNGKRIDYPDLAERVEKERMKHNKLDVAKLTALLYVDRNMPMSEVVKLKEELRKVHSLKIADAGYPQGDLKVSPLLYHAVALPRILPPTDAEIMDKDDVQKKGIEIFVIDLSARNTNPRDVQKGLSEFIRANDGGKYVYSLEYDGSIPYRQYLESVDLVFNVVYSFRNELAMKKYQTSYSELGDDLQKEIRQAYPMVLSEAWSGV